MSDVKDLKEKVPQVGDEVLVPVGEDDVDELTIDEVGEFDEDLGLWAVTAEGSDLMVYWSEEDKSWVHEEEA